MTATALCRCITQWPHGFILWGEPRLSLSASVPLCTHRSICGGMHTDDVVSAWGKLLECMRAPTLACDSATAQ